MLLAPLNYGSLEGKTGTHIIIIRYAEKKPKSARSEKSGFETLTVMFFRSFHENNGLVRFRLQRVKARELRS